jgi:hypothetical protein
MCHCIYGTNVPDARPAVLAEIFHGFPQSFILNQLAIHCSVTYAVDKTLLNKQRFDEKLDALTEPLKCRSPLSDTCSVTH